MEKLEERVNPKSEGKVKKCKACKRSVVLVSRGLCNRCYKYHGRAGTLSKFPKTMKLRKIGKCKRCHKIRLLTLKGLCDACHLYLGNFSFSVAGRKVSIKLNVDTDKEHQSLKRIYKKQRKKLMDDIIKNPRKWLDKI